MNIRIKRYKKSAKHSYTMGVFPTLELLRHQPTDISSIIVHPRGKRNRGVDKIWELCQQYDIPFDIQERSFSRIGARENDYAIGIFQKYEPGLDSTTNHVILVNPQVMGNLGTIIRTMIGFGFKDLVIIGEAADIFNPDVVRASMGALFQLRFNRFHNFKNYQEDYPRKFYPMMTDGSLTLYETQFEPPYGLIFGPENAGLPNNYINYGPSIKIPQSSAIDSLNLAVSVGVTLYQTTIPNMHNPHILNEN